MTHPHLQTMSVAQCDTAYNLARASSKMAPAEFDAEVTRLLANRLSSRPAKAWHFVAIGRVVAQLVPSKAA